MNNIPKTKQLSQFKNEDEECGYLADREVSDIFDASKPIVNPLPPNLEPSTKIITLRISESLLYVLKELANKKDVPYQ